MKKLLLFLLCLAAFIVFAASPTFNSFNLSQFTTSANSNTVSIAPGVLTTNQTNYGTLTLPNITGGSGYFVAVDASGNVTAEIPAGGGGSTNAVTNGGTGYDFDNVTITNLTIPTGGTLNAAQATLNVSNVTVQQEISGTNRADAGVYSNSLTLNGVTYQNWPTNSGAANAVTTNILAGAYGLQTNISGPCGVTNMTATTTNIQGWMNGYPAFTNYTLSDLLITFTYTNYFAASAGVQIIWTNGPSTPNPWMYTHTNALCSYSASVYMVCPTNSTNSWAISLPGTFYIQWLQSGTGNAAYISKNLTPTFTSSGTVGAFSHSEGTQALSITYNENSTNSMNLVLLQTIHFQ